MINQESCRNEQWSDKNPSSLPPKLQSMRLFWKVGTHPNCQDYAEGAVFFRRQNGLKCFIVNVPCLQLKPL